VVGGVRIQAQSLTRSLAGAALAALAIAPVLSGAEPPRERPRLVLFVSVDQMHAEYLEHFAPLFTGGFKRLLEQGAVFSNAYYRHSNSETGPGHSVLLSGRHASSSGIIANEWYDPILKKSINVVSDPVQQPLGGPGRAASPTNFLAVTVGDLLKKASPDSRVVGVSMKDRSAILMSGRRADAAYWYEAKAGRFITSTYYRHDVPPWLETWNASGKVDALFGTAWQRMLPDTSLYEQYAGPDAVEGEWDRVDTVFPHAIRGAAKTEAFYDDVRRTPFIDELVLDVALKAIDADELGKDDATDLLAVGFSATDVIGHTYGPDSQEMMDQLLRLDRTLGRLLDEVDKRVGPGRVLFGLSADHSSMPLVEILQKQGKPARRVPSADLEKPIRDAVHKAFPDAGELIAAFDEPHIYLDLERVARQGLKRADVEAVVSKAMLATGLVEHTFTHAQLMGDPPPNDANFVLFRNSFFAPRSPHVIAQLKPYIYLEDVYSGGTGHGTVYDYDRHIPVVFMGAGVKPGRYAERCGPEDIAPSLSRILGLDYALESDQRVLTEMLTP
jgi:predicted AlkP superfamily pyrophosphatase or phosphodiesterase